jgi:membrane protease YdiL (CAAX protease family)
LTVQVAGPLNWPVAGTGGPVTGTTQTPAHGEPVVPPADRFRRIERGTDDFPYYNGRPVEITTSRWLVVIAAVVLAFALLVLLPLDGSIIGFIPAILFAGIPLGALAYAARGRWRAIFRKVTGRDIGLMFAFAALNIIITFGVGAIVAVSTGAKANPMAGALEDASAVELALFYPQTAIQLVGEELVTILPFLALLYWFAGRGTMTRKRGVILAWIITSVWFGLLHLPTYDWSLIQCILVIGTARLVLTLAYLRTKNLWVSAGAHIINDWVLFSFPLVAAAFI